MLCMFSYGYLILYMYSFAWITPDFIMNALHEPIVDSTGDMYLKSLGSYSSHQLSGNLFSRILLQRFATKWGTSIATIVVTILFALLHVDFLGAAIFSIVLSIVYIRNEKFTHANCNTYVKQCICNRCVFSNK